MQRMYNPSNKYHLPQIGDTVLFANDTQGVIKNVTYIKSHKNSKSYLQRVQFEEVPWTIIYDFYGRARETDEFISDIIKVIPHAGKRLSSQDQLKSIQQMAQE